MRVPSVFLAIITGLIVFRALNCALDRLLNSMSGAGQIMCFIFCVYVNYLKECALAVPALKK